MSDTVSDMPIPTISPKKYVQIVNIAHIVILERPGWAWSYCKELFDLRQSPMTDHIIGDKAIECPECIEGLSYSNSMLPLRFTTTTIIPTYEKSND